MRYLFILLTTATLAFLQISTAMSQQKSPAILDDMPDEMSTLIEGVWRTKDGDSHVKIVPCEKGLCNEIIWLKQPNDKQGKPMTDKLNNVKRLRARPVVGISILLKMHRVSETKWKGWLYKPRHGKSYAGHVRLINAGKLEVKGCHSVFPICKTQLWKKISSIEEYKTQ